MAAAKGYEFEPQALELANTVFACIYKSKDEKFGNARTVRNFFERTVSAQADRLASAKGTLNRTQLIAILKTDLPVREFAPALAASLSEHQLKAQQDEILGDIRLT